MGNKVKSVIKKLGIVLLVIAIIAGGTWIVDAIYWANQPREINRVWDGILLPESGETRPCTVRLDGLLRREGDILQFERSHSGDSKGCVFVDETPLLDVTHFLEADQIHICRIDGVGAVLLDPDMTKFGAKLLGEVLDPALTGQTVYVFAPYLPAELMPALEDVAINQCVSATHGAPWVADTHCFLSVFHKNGLKEPFLWNYPPCGG